jgi:hypothetical protein
MRSLSRRQFLASTSAARMRGSVPSLPISVRPVLAMPANGDHALWTCAGANGSKLLDYRTTMAHPIHLLGRYFQVVSLKGERFAGAARDTVPVPSRGNVTIAFEASNPGKWALHRHPLYPMAGGMMTNLDYRS